MKIGDTLTVVDRGLIRCAHVTSTYADNRTIGAVATAWRQGHKTYAWSGQLLMSEEGITWVRGAHARKGQPTTAAGRALLVAYTLRAS